MQTKNFLAALFDSEDSICMAADNKGTDVWPQDINYYKGLTSELPQYFSINPLHPTQDLCPTEPWHDANRPRRANGNVVKYRNILIEFDNLSLEEQLKYVQEIDLPFTTAVYSGGKSYHFIIALTKPLSGPLEYSALVDRIYQVAPQSDRSCRNPSRLSRFPGHYRDGQVEQKLIEVRDRVPNQLLENWLNINGAPAVPVEQVGPAREVGTDELYMAHGTRWEGLRRLAGRLRAWGLGADAIQECLVTIYEYHCEHKPGDTSIDDDMKRLSRWAARRPPGNTKPQPINADGKTVRMIMPDGKVFKVPAHKIEEMQDQGGKKL